jgi:hypothetical protein
MTSPRNGIFVGRDDGSGNIFAEQQVDDPSVGDMVYFGSPEWEALSPDTAYKILQTQGAGSAPAWSGYKLYPSSGTNPASPAPTAGDLYYNTVLAQWMYYDGARSKWLSVESFVLLFGRLGATPAGAYYKGADGIAFSASSGHPAFWDGTIVALGYTRTDSDSVTFEVTEDGTSISTLASTATSGYTLSLNDDFSQGSILGVRNQTGGNVIQEAHGWVRLKWRV